MKPVAAAILAVVFVVFVFGAGFFGWSLGARNQKALDSAAIAKASEAEQSAIQREMAESNRFTSQLVPMEKELDEWHGLFPGGPTQAQEETNQLERNGQSASLASSVAIEQLRVCREQEQQIAAARHAEQTQGTEAALKILTLLLR